MRIYISYFILILLISSCGEEIIKVDGTIQGKEYFPIEIGREWVYKSDSVVYDESMGLVDTVSGYIREVISDLAADGTYVIERSFKRELSGNWKITDIWSGRIEGTRAIKTEENLSFIKLVFPPDKFKTWDGNSFFDENVEIVVAGEPLQPYQGWAYEIIDVDGIYTEDTINVSNVIEVEQVDAVSIIDRRYSIERFAPDIGMVEKKMMILDCQCSNIPDTVPWEEKAEKGFILTQRLISYK